MKEQGYECDPILHQDNTSAILLETNGIGSAGKRSRHINIRHYWIKDQIDKDVMKVGCCPADEMVADFHSKPLQGEKHRKFRKVIVNLPITQCKDTGDSS